MGRASKGVVSVLPAAFAAEGEANPALKKLKVSLAKGFSFTRADQLAGTVRLAWSLLALGRSDEAVEVASFVANHVAFDGNYSLWGPVGDALFLLARTHRRAGRAAEHEAAVARVREHGNHAVVPRSVVLAEVEEVPARLEQARAEKSASLGVLFLLVPLTTLCRLREGVGQGMPNSEGLDLRLLEALLDETLEALRVRLR